MKCAYCGDDITITRSKSVPMWDIKCSCTTVQHAHLDYGIYKHQWQASKPNENHQPPEKQHRMGNNAES